jgi:hypothetical protein
MIRTANSASALATKKDYRYQIWFQSLEVVVEDRKFWLFFNKILFIVILEPEAIKLIK